MLLILLVNRDAALTFKIISKRKAGERLICLLPNTVFLFNSFIFAALNKAI